MPSVTQEIFWSFLYVRNKIRLQLSASVNRKSGGSALCRAQNDFDDESDIFMATLVASQRNQLLFLNPGVSLLKWFRCMNLVASTIFRMLSASTGWSCLLLLRHYFWRRSMHSALPLKCSRNWRNRNAQNPNVAPMLACWWCCAIFYHRILNRNIAIQDVFCFSGHTGNIDQGVCHQGMCMFLVVLQRVTIIFDTFRQIIFSRFINYFETLTSKLLLSFGSYPSTSRCLLSNSVRRVSRTT